MRCCFGPIVASYEGRNETVPVRNYSKKKYNAVYYLAICRELGSSR